MPMRNLYELYTDAETELQQFVVHEVRDLFRLAMLQQVRDHALRDLLLADGFKDQVNLPRDDIAYGRWMM